MKIVLCNTIRSWGGGEKWHYEMACELSRRGHEIYFILHPNSVLAQKIMGQAIVPVKMSIGNLSFFNPITLCRIYRTLRGIIPDVLIINRPAEMKVLALMGKCAGIRQIVYRRGSDVTVKNNLVNRFFLEKMVNKIIANSEATKRSLLITGMHLDKKIRVIYNGVGIPCAEREHNVSKYRMIVGAVGRLSKQKGFDLLVDIAASLKERKVDGVEIQIVGEGSERENLERAIAEKGLRDYLVLKGFREDVAGFLNRCDVFVLTSRYEGFGYVVVEAMLCGCPVVAFDVSSISEIVQDGSTGYLVPAFDLDRFVDKVEFLIENKELGMEMGQRGRQIAEQYFSFDASVDRLVKFIQE
ncbi:MAG: glycosyltransferase [Breznakibacter sp.]